jgi:hypothetical protein
MGNNGVANIKSCTFRTSGVQAGNHLKNFWLLHHHPCRSSLSTGYAVVIPPRQ